MGELKEDVIDRIPDVDPVLQAEREAKKNKVDLEKLIPTIDELPPAGFEPEEPERKVSPAPGKTAIGKKSESRYPGVDPEKMARDFRRVRPRKDIDD